MFISITFRFSSHMIIYSRNGWKLVHISYGSKQKPYTLNLYTFSFIHMNYFDTDYLNSNGY